MRSFVALVCGVCWAFTFTAKAQSLPEGKGKAEFQRICGTCHAVTIATGQRMTQAQWAGVVNDMVSRGAQGSQVDLDNVVNYLSANYGKDKPASATPEPAPPTVATQQEPPLSDAQVSEGNRLLETNGCLSCHRVGQAGSYLGPNLSDLGGHRTADQIRASIVSPNKEVIPENRSVKLVTKEGNTVTGRLLNQDGFSVQLIDSASELRSFQKSGLREFRIITTNPMPPYGNKLRAAELTDLVNYLSSLKEIGTP